MKPEYKLPLIVGHRGASALAPENTLAAFRRAVVDGAEGIELDVRLAKDGVPVVFHDLTLKRIAGRKTNVSNLTSAELRSIDAGSWFNRAFPGLADPAYIGESVPTLAETLGSIQNISGVIYVELKCGDVDAQHLARAACEAIAGSELIPKIVVKSFALRTIPYIREHFPDIRTAALFAPKMRTLLQKEKHLVRLAEELGAHELSLHFTLATRKLMQMADESGFPVAIWTADNPRWVKRGFQLGLKAIITNNPARLISKRREMLAADRGGISPK